MLRGVFGGFVFFSESLYVLHIHFAYTVVDMPKSGRMFRLNLELYNRFKDLASGSGYTVTRALEKFMSSCVENEVLSFPSPVAAEGDLEAEVRIMLAWLKKGQHWYCFESGEKEFSVEGRLLQLLPRIRDRALKEQIEVSLKVA
ncbi:MAG: hypothetical protein ABSG57_03415 [Candidatus Bathyarchaeia archaeon]